VASLDRSSSPTPPIDLPVHRPAALALAGMVTLAITMAVGRFAFTPLLPMMQADAGVSLATGAALASANYLGYFVGSALAVLITRGLGRWIRFGLVGVTAGTAAMGLTDAVWAWFALRFLTGIASALVLIFGATWMFNRLAEAGKPRWGAFVFTGIGTGVATTGLLCLALVVFGASADATWLLLAALCALGTAAVWPFYRPRPASSVAAAAGPRAPLSRAAWRLTFAYAAFGFAYIVPATFLPVMAQSVLAGGGAHGPVWAYAAFWPLFGLAAAASTLLTLRLTAPDDVQLRVALVAQAIGVAAPALSAHPLAIVASAVLVGGTFVLITLTSLRVARQVEPTQATRLFAVITTWFALFQIVGPLVAERLVAMHGSFDAALWVAAVCLAAGAVVTPVSRARHA
jgi:MFS family permease